MGYYTTHTLEIIEGDHDLIEVLIAINENASIALDANGDCKDDCKWYEHEEDLRKFSIEFPDALFKLSGLGEENGDMWDEYYRNGKMQRCKAKIVFNDFDANELL